MGIHAIVVHLYQCVLTMGLRNDSIGGTNIQEVAYLALSDAQRKANDKYIREHYRQVKLSMPNEEADILEAHCTTFGYTKAGFIRQAIREKMERDSATTEGEEK